MRRTIAAVLLFAAIGCASRNTEHTKSYSQQQACASGTCTGAAPYWDGGFYSDGGCCSAAGFSEGISLLGVTSWRLAYAAWNYSAVPAGGTAQTVSDAGVFNVYFCDSQSQACFYNPSLDQGAGCHGLAACAQPDFKTGWVSPFAVDTLAVVANGVTVNGTDGGPLTVFVYTYSDSYQSP